LPGDTGWDVFCLEYNIDLPLNIVISSRNILDYQKMFIFLLKIKKIEYSQNLEWRKIMTYCHNIPNSKYPFFKSKIKKSLQFNQLIMHFIISLHDYLTLEVLESQYKKLLKRIKCINSIDELILAHNEFVNSIKQKCFLDNKNNNNIIIYKKIISIFDIILRFRTAQDVLFSTLLQKISDLDEGEKSLNSQNSEEENEIDINYNKRIDESIKQIAFLYEEFINKIIELINTMKNFGLNYLSMRFDFNYYYSNIEKEKEEEEQQKLIEKINKEQNRIRLEKKNQRQNLYKDIEYDKNKNNSKINNYNIQNNEEINEYNYQMSGDNEENNIKNINEDVINYNYTNNNNNIYNKYTSQINNTNEYNYQANINNINNNINDNNYNNYLYKYKSDEEQGDEGMEEDENNENDNND
jgi:gamma-tubulin complex component 3